MSRVTPRPGRALAPASLAVTHGDAPSGMLSVFALLPGVTTETARPTTE